MIALEVAGLDRTYGWRKEEGQTLFRRVTVFPDRYYDDLTEKDLQRKLFEQLDAIDPEAVAINGYGFIDSRVCLSWCRTRKRKAILMTETTLVDKPRLILRELAKRILLKRFSAAVCGGILHRAYLRSLGMPAHRIFTKYDVVDNDYFARPAVTIERESSLPGLDDARPFFLASGRFIGRKNIACLLSAYMRYREATPDSAAWGLVLLGDGEEEPALRTQVSSNSIPDVTFAGFRQIEDLSLYYQRAGCFIHPALAEPWGLVVNEAMAAGLPVIVSTGVGCAPDLVEPGANGYVFDPASPTDLAANMAAISRDPDLRATMGRRSREIISSWKPRDFAQSLWRAFEVPDDSYRVVYFGRRKLVAYRDDKFSKKLSRTRRIETFTLRRRMAFALVRGAIAAGVDRYVFRRTSVDDPAIVSVAVANALTQVCQCLKQEKVDYLFTWSAEPWRRRTYAYVFPRTGDKCAFVKLSEADDAALLRNGFETLEALTAISHPRFKFPCPLAFGSFGNATFHVTECVPTDNKNSRDRLASVSAESCVESYGGSITEISPVILSEMGWMKRFWETVDKTSYFAHTIEEDQRLATRCRRVHGDLTVANLIASGDHIWIIDWELSDAKGPCLTDMVTFFLGLRQRELVKNPMSILRQFRASFIDARPLAEAREARMALAFLQGANSGLGRRLVEAWNEVGTDA
jgi:glycosyltransferase involved in cell wall biosynthesis